MKGSRSVGSSLSRQTPYSLAKGDRFKRPHSIASSYHAPSGGSSRQSRKSGLDIGGDDDNSNLKLTPDLRTDLQVESQMLGFLRADELQSAVRDVCICRNMMDRMSPHYRSFFLLLTGLPEKPNPEHVDQDLITEVSDYHERHRGQLTELMQAVKGFNSGRSNLMKLVMRHIRRDYDLEPLAPAALPLISEDDHIRNVVSQYSGPQNIHKQYIIHDSKVLSPHTIFY